MAAREGVDVNYFARLHQVTVWNRKFGASG
jgi:hypothetical protein